MPRLPPVDMSPQARLRARFWPGSTPSVETRRQSHSSSSATSWASPVSVPCPISERAMRITQSLLGRITTQMPTSLPAFCACCADASGRSKPSASPPPATAAEPTMKLRREISMVLSWIVLVMADLPDIRICDWRGRTCRCRCHYRPPGERPHGCADRCRTGRYWSSRRRCPCRWGAASSATAPPRP